MHDMCLHNDELVTGVSCSFWSQNNLDDTKQNKNKAGSLSSSAVERGAIVSKSPYLAKKNNITLMA